MTQLSNVLVQYNNTGATTYPITFEYDERSQVSVKEFDEASNSYIDFTDWEFNGVSEIRFTNGTPSNFAILRTTDISNSYGAAKYAVFAQGSAIKASDLNGNLELLRLRIEEITLPDTPLYSVDLDATADATNVTVTNTGGDDAVLPAATSTTAGVMTAANYNLLDSLSTNSTNLSTTQTATEVTINNSTGTDAVINPVTSTQAGVMTPTQLSQIGVSSIIGGDRITVSPASGTGDVTITGDLSPLDFKGDVDVTSNTIPGSLKSQDLFINTGTGNFSSTWATATVNATTADTAKPGDFLVYNGSQFSHIKTAPPSTNYLSLAANAGDQTVQSTGTTTFAGNLEAPNYYISNSAGTLGYPAGTGPYVVAYSDSFTADPNIAGNLDVAASKDLRLNAANIISLDQNTVTDKSVSFINSAVDTSIIFDGSGSAYGIRDAVKTLSGAFRSSLEANYGSLTNTGNASQVNGVTVIGMDESTVSSVNPNLTRHAGFISAVNVGTYGSTNPNGIECFNFIATGNAPNFFGANTYIGGSASRNTRELWESTLTEEQKEQLSAGTLAIPANVSNPGDGSFVRQWWYDQQSAEDQALIDSGELKYPNNYQPENFVDTFDIGDNTSINLLSNGTVEASNYFIGKGDGAIAGTVGIGGSAEPAVVFYGSNAGTAVDGQLFINAPSDITLTSGEGSIKVLTPTIFSGDVAINADSTINGSLLALPQAGDDRGIRSAFAVDTGVAGQRFCYNNGCVAQADATEIYGYFSNIVNEAAPNGKAYNFYATGNAPNYFAGETYWGNTDQTTTGFAGIINNSGGRKSLLINGGAISLRADTDDPIATNVTGVRFLSYEAIFSRNGGTTTETAVRINRGDGNPDSVASRAITFYRNGNEYGGIDISSAGAAFNNTSDYRVKTNIRDYTGASSVIQALNVKQYTLFDKPDVVGFIAHELQEHVPDAVKGTKDATEAIGTFTEYDGTVLEENIPQPHPEEMEYTVEVVDETQPTIEGEEPRMVEVTRTRTWTATGTRPVYQGVDQTKLIPLLTKALQEALERIEVLEADHATLMNNNSNY